MKEYFCASPWTGLYIDPSGRIDNCCISQNNIGNINHDDINSIVNGEKNLTIKNQMLLNQQVSGCDSCFRNNPSHRFQNFWNDNYSNLGNDFFSDRYNFSLKYIDLRWNNTCNLACIYCGGGYSSLWAEIEKKQDPTGNTLIPVEQKPSRYKETLLSYLETHVGELEHVYLAGGEPLMLKENVRLLDAILAVKSNCRIVVNSNLTQLSNSSVFERLKQHHNVQWLVSGETIGDQFEYIRWPARWKDFYDNLQIINNIPGHSISFNFVAMNINALIIWDFVDLIEKELGVAQQSMTTNIYNMRNDTGPFSIQRLSSEMKKQIKERAKSYKTLGIDNFLSSLDDPTPAHRPEKDGLVYTWEKLAELDRMRDLDSRKIFKHIYEI